MSDVLNAGGDYYEILGVVRTATPEEIAAAFRELARKWHPDVCPGVSQASTNFKRIADAYEVLGNPEKRRQYDVSQAGSHRHVTFPVRHRAARTRSAPDSSFGRDTILDRFNVFRDLRDLHDLMESFFGTQWAEPVGTARQPRPTLDVNAELRLTPEEARQGGIVQFTISFDQDCPQCAGRGVDIRGLCSRCESSGRIQQGPEVLAVRVPSGVWNGSTIRIRGKGKAPVDRGSRGDLILQIRVQPSW